MREVATRGRIEEFLQRLARAADGPVRVYLTGGATAVLTGWRESTVDVDLDLVPESDELLRAIARLKDELFERIEPELYRYPAIDAPSFRAAVERFVDEWPGP